MSLFIFIAVWLAASVVAAALCARVASAGRGWPVKPARRSGDAHSVSQSSAAPSRRGIA